jgi:hypothetical protein
MDTFIEMLEKLPDAYYLTSTRIRHGTGDRGALQTNYWTTNRARNETLW